MANPGCSEASMKSIHAHIGAAIALAGVLLLHTCAQAHDWMPLNTRYCCKALADRHINPNGSPHDHPGPHDVA